jgi:hypothetical protein
VFDGAAGTPTTVTAGTPVTDAPLAPVVPLRRGGRSGALAWLGAAAAAAAVVVGVASLGGRDQDDDFAGAPSEESIVSFALESADEAPTAASDGMTTMGVPDDDASGGTAQGSDDSVETTTDVDPAAATFAPGDEPADVTPAGEAVILEDARALSRLAESAVSLEVVPVCAPDADLLTSNAVFGDDPSRPPLVVEVVREESGDIVAYDLVDCSEAARAPRG